MVIPPTDPSSTHIHTFMLTSAAVMTPAAASTKRSAALIVPVRNALAGARPENAFTMPMPTNEQSKPVDAKANGRNIRSSGLCAINSHCDTAKVAAMAIEAIIALQ